MKKTLFLNATLRHFQNFTVMPVVKVTYIAVNNPDYSETL